MSSNITWTRISPGLPTFSVGWKNWFIVVYHLTIKFRDNIQNKPWSFLAHPTPLLNKGQNLSPLIINSKRI